MTRAAPERAALRLRVKAGEFGGVYFVAAGNFVKIGEAANPLARVANLSTGCPFPMALIGVDRHPYAWQRQAAEQAWHARLAEWRYRGEWFRATPEVLAAAYKLPPMPDEYLSGGWIT